MKNRCYKVFYSKKRAVECDTRKEALSLTKINGFCRIIKYEQGKETSWWNFHNGELVESYNAKNPQMKTYKVDLDFSGNDTRYVVAKNSNEAIEIAIKEYYENFFVDSDNTNVLASNVVEYKK